jgi:uncharacterized membrane protein (DUF373 family)
VQQEFGGDPRAKATTLIRQAATALRQSKADPMREAQEFNDQDERNARRRLRLTSELQNAVTNVKGTASMSLKKDLADARESWAPLSFYEKFEHACILILTALIALIIALAIWNLVLKILINLLASTLDPTDYAVFQALFGMIFTVIIALEFKRSLLVLAERVDSVVQVRAVLLIALLAVVRKLILLDVKATDALQLLALAAAILALGAAYWMVRDQDRRRTDAKAAEKTEAGHRTRHPG